MTERTFESEKDRLIREGADPKLFDTFIVQKLFVELIEDPLYGNADERGKLEIVHINPDNSGTFNIRTGNISGYTMARFQNGDVKIQRIDITHHKRPIDYDPYLGYRDRHDDTTIINEDGKVVKQSILSTIKHGFLSAKK